RASLMRTPASIFMTGPGFGLDNYNFGAIMANELLLWFILALAIMSIMQVIRHTRAEEETSRSELIRAGAVGRHAPAAAGFLTVVVANLVVALISLAIMVAVGGLPVFDSVIYAGGAALVALVFAAVALVFGHASEHGRTAIGVSIAVVIAAIMVRAIGDLAQVGGNFVSWLSPIGLMQQTRVFVDLRLAPLAILVVLLVVLLAVGAFLASRRDFGAGLVAVKRGRADAVAGLRSPLSLAWVQQRRSLMWWAVGFAVGFLAFGTYLDGGLDEALADLVDQTPALAHILNPENMAAAFAGIMLLFGALIALSYGISGIARARGEETAGRAELLLATPTSRVRWLAAQIGIPMAGAAGLMVLSGLMLWLGAVTTGAVIPSFGTFFLGALAYVPALLLVLALAAALYAWFPGAVAVTWALVAWGFVVGLFGSMLDLPTAVLRTNPFYWVPNPFVASDAVTMTAGVSWGAALLVLVIAGALTALAIVGFNRRDVPKV
ncbi:MAG: hypothetical protein FWG25_08115, partial [Promicromonosporaceae bacterium]|nr:hypothetical protein [Promicromonosporaceae bacterium]